MKNWIPVIFIFLITACSSGVKNSNQIKSTPEVVSDGAALFDGKTLTGWEKTNFGTQGHVQVSEGNIILSYGDGCTGINYLNDFPLINYEVNLEAMKVSGNDFFCGMTFPVNETFCSLIVGGWGGPVVGLSTIDGIDASENETKILKNFEKDVWYSIKLKVTNERIETWIDEEKLVDFEIGEHKLSIRPEVGLSTPFGICSWNTTAALRNIYLKKL